MTWGNLASEPSLAPLFGPLTPERNKTLVAKLLEIDDRLETLAVEASSQVNVPYKRVRLGLFVRARDAEVAGGLSGDAGDIWCELTYTGDERAGQWSAPPWTVDSRIIVFCCDRQPTRHDQPCLHDLVKIIEQATTPEATLELLADHLGRIEDELSRLTPSRVTRSTHADLPPTD